MAALNSSENIANSMASLYFAGRELFNYLDQIATITLDEVNDALGRLLNRDRAALSVVLPVETEV